MALSILWLAAVLTLLTLGAYTNPSLQTPIARADFASSQKIISPQALGMAAVLVFGALTTVLTIVL